jgi:hypothetical protein
MRALIALLLLCAATARGAAVPKSPPADVELDFPNLLAGGSEAAAGLDPATAGEIVHPSNPAALLASLRSAGAVLQGGQQSFVVQFNPYLLTQGYQQLYLEAVGKRKSRITRYLQDSAITLALTEDTPYAGVIVDDGRFATLSAGASVDIFGERSIYGEAYGTCMNGVLQTSADELGQLPGPPLRDDFATDAEFKQAEASFPEELERARQALVGRARVGLSACTRQVRQASSALFLSAGGRWVMPGLQSQEGDGAVIQRGFGAATLELRSSDTGGVELALQLRGLYERQRPGVAMDKWLDAGLSVGIASPRLSLKLEATQSFAKLEGTETRRASIVGTSRIVLSESLSVGIGVQGQGEDLSRVFGQLRPTIVLNYADLPGFVVPVKTSN